MGPPGADVARDCGDDSAEGSSTYVRIRDLRRHYPWACTAAVYAAAFAACQRLPWWTGSSIADVVSNVAILPLNIAFVAVFWRAANRPELDPRVSRAFRLLAAAEAMVIVGDVSGIAINLLGHRDPTWSWPNVPYLVYYPLAIAAFLWLPRTRRTRLEWWKFALDSTTIVIGSAVSIWYIVVRVGAAHDAVQHPVLALSFPIADLVLLFSLTTVALRPPYGVYTKGFTLLLTGQVLSVIGDLLYTLVSSVTTSQVRPWADTVYVASYVLLIASAERYLRSSDGARRAQGREPASAQTYESPIPYGIAAAVYVLVLVVATRKSATDLGLLIVGAAPVTLLLAARGVVTGRQTAELLAQRAVRVGEARFRALVQHASDAIMILAADGTVRFASPAAQRVLGISGTALEGVALTSFVEPADELVLATLLADVRRSSGATVSATWRARHADSTVRHIETVATNLTDEPAVAGLVLSARDVTERHQLQERLGHAQRLEAVGQLAGGVAHDFNNILTAISGNAELALADLPAASPATDSLREIRDAVTRATALTRQLLAFSRKQVLRPQVVDLNSVVTGCERMLARLIPEDVHLRVSLDKQLPPVIADPGQLEQALVNLVLNARDAMPSGGQVRIDTGCSLIDIAEARESPGFAPGQYSWVSVRDTGIGMDDATRARMFEPFFTTKPPGRGTGLGLATVYGIVKQSGGYVYADSAPDRGSTFTMYFPPASVAAVSALPRAVSLHPEAPSPHGAPPQAGWPTRSGATVLVVEDEPAVRAAIAQALARHGFNVLQAVDGADGVAVGARHAGPIDLVVSDVIMPHLTGPAMIERLRSTRPDLRALFISGYAAPQLRGKLAAVASGVLEKPFTLATLTERVCELLDPTPDLTGVSPN
jgi:PAS domain S-box-containing protein